MTRRSRSPAKATEIQRPPAPADATEIQRPPAPADAAEIRIRGPERADERELREWAAALEKGNLERLEEAAKTIAQIVSGLYGVLLALLAFASDPLPAYLRDPAVRWLSSVSLAALFLALLATIAVGYPRRSSYTEDNLTSLRRLRSGLQRFKAWSLRLAMLCFVIGMACLGTLIGWVLWTI